MAEAYVERAKEIAEHIIRIHRQERKEVEISKTVEHPETDGQLREVKLQSKLILICPGLGHNPTRREEFRWLPDEAGAFVVPGCLGSDGQKLRDRRDRYSMGATMRPAEDVEDHVSLVKPGLTEGDKYKFEINKYAILDDELQECLLHNHGSRWEKIMA